MGETACTYQAVIRRIATWTRPALFWMADLNAAVLAEAADGIGVESGSDDHDSDSGDGFEYESDDFSFPEDAADAEAAAKQRMADADCDTVNRQVVEEEVHKQVADAADGGQICGTCGGVGHDGLMLLCDGPKLLPGQKKRKKLCNYACHTFCCDPPLEQARRSGRPQGPAPPFATCHAPALQVPDSKWYCKTCEAATPAAGPTHEAPPAEPTAEELRHEARYGRASQYAVGTERGGRRVKLDDFGKEYWI